MSLCVVGFKMIGGVFPVGGIPVVLGLVVAVVVALTSRNDCPPIYHFVSAMSPWLSVVMMTVSYLPGWGLVLPLFGSTVWPMKLLTCSRYRNMVGCQSYPNQHRHLVLSSTSLMQY